MKTNILYLCLYELLKRRYGYRTITKKELFCELGKHFLVPKNARILIVKEMEQLKLLKQTEEGLSILKCSQSLEKDINKFYQYFKIF